MYKDLTFKKISFIVAVVALLTGSVYASFYFWKNDRATLAYYLSRASIFPAYLVNRFEYESGQTGSPQNGLLATIAAIFFGGGQGTTPVAQADAAAQAVPVLLYHGLLSTPDGVNTLTSDFKEQMFAMKRAGWQTVTLPDFEAFLKGEKRLPPNSFLLTFDDGRRDSFYQADPILQALGYNAVMFAITSHSLTDAAPGGYYLSKSELQQMERTGRWDIQAHTRDGHDPEPIDAAGTMGHFYADRLWLPAQGRSETDAEFRARITADLAGAKSDIESGLGTQVSAIAWPFSDYGEESQTVPNAPDIVVPIARQFYDLSFYQEWPARDYNESYFGENLFLVPRIEPKSDWTPEDLLLAVNAGQTKVLPYTDTFSLERQSWALIWGGIRYAPGALQVSANATGTGAATFLNGSYPWTDYEVQAAMTQQSGREAGLMVRLADPSHYVACELSGDTVLLHQHLGAVDTVLSQSQPLAIKSRTFQLGAKAYGMAVECLLNGVPVAYASGLDARLSQGGIGFQVWDPQSGAASVLVSSVSAAPLTSAFAPLPPAPAPHKGGSVLAAHTSSAGAADNANTTVAVLPPPAPTSTVPDISNDSTAATTTPSSTDTVPPSPPPAPPPPSLPYVNDPFTYDSNWNNDWGTYTIDPLGFHLAATPQTSGAELFLDGSEPWGNYNFAATVDWAKGDSLSLLARYQDSNNYVRCLYTENAPDTLQVQLQQVMDGHRTTLAVASNISLDSIDRHDLPVAIGVDGPHALCQLDGKEIVRTLDRPVNPPFSGKLGILTSDASLYNSEIIIKKINIQPIE